MDEKNEGGVAMVKNDSIMLKLKDFKKALGKHWRIEEMILFGSYVKGGATKNSDIDVCVVSEDFDDVFRVGVEIDKLADQIDDKLEIHVMRPDQLRNKYNTLAQEVLKYGQVI